MIMEPDLKFPTNTTYYNYYVLNQIDIICITIILLRCRTVHCERKATIALWHSMKNNTH